jgi:integrase
MAKIVKLHEKDPKRLRYVVDYYDLQGRRRKERFRKERDAKVRLGEVISQRETGELRPRSDDLRFRGLVDDWRLASMSKRSRNTQAIYRWLLDAFLLPEFGQRKLRTITPRDCEQLHAKIKERTAVSERAKGGRVTANMALGLLRQILNYAEGHDYVARNVARHAKAEPAPFEERRRRIEGDVLTPDELRKLFDAAEGMHRVLLMTAALSGLRRGELLGLTWGDIDWSSSRLHVRQQMVHGELARPKSPAALRSVPLPAELVTELKPWRLRCPKGPLDLVFPNGDGGPLPLSTADSGLHQALRRAKLRRVTLHALRHGYASALISAGASVKVVQRLMGHANIQMTLQTYAHVMPGDDDGVRAVLSNKVFGNAARATGT